jgi:hypothetical protein
VVNALDFFPSFDLQIGRDVSPACFAALAGVQADAEAAWGDADARAAMLALFKTPDYFTLQDFLWLLADSAAMVRRGGRGEAQDAGLPAVLLQNALPAVS